MSFRAEINHLLPVSSSQQGINYDTFDYQGNHNTVSTGEGQHEQEGMPSVLTPEQTPNEPIIHEHAQQRLSSFLSSRRPLKYSAIVFGQWTEIGRCSLAVRILIAISILSVGFILRFNSVQFCAFGFPYSEQGNNFNVTIYHKTTPDYWMILIAVIPSYLTMVYCVRDLSGRTKVLRLPQAFKLAKKTNWVNIILLLSIIVMAATMILRLNCFPFLFPKTCMDEYNEIKSTGYPEYFKGLYLAWHFFLAVVAWQAVIGCLMFDIVIKALTALVIQCLDRIITTHEAHSVDHYIQVHQELCCNVESTFTAFKKWFHVNTFAYIVLIVYIVLDKVFYFPLLLISDGFPYEACYLSFSKKSDIPVQDHGGMESFYLLVLFLYASFMCYHPWYSMANLKRSLDCFVQKLNDKTDWHPQHPFKNRLYLNSFLQYVKTTECRPFMRFTCSTKIPYFSAMLAVFGLLLALYRSSQQSTNSYHHRQMDIPSFPITSASP